MNISSTVLPKAACLIQAETHSTFRAQLEGLAASLGFEYFAVLWVDDQAPPESRFTSWSNEPADFAQKVDASLGSKDPVMSHCRGSGLPLVWNEATYLEAGASDLWEGLNSAGFRTGIAMAMHLPEGKHLAFGVEGRELPCKSVQSLERAIGEVHLIAAYAVESAKRLAAPTEEQRSGFEKPLGSVLSAREVQVLQWTAVGKTSWEVSVLLNISINTVSKHLGSAMRKLGCVNSRQAAVRAINLGLIKP